MTRRKTLLRDPLTNLPNPMLAPMLAGGHTIV